MRKKIMKAAFVAVFAAVAGYGVYMNQRTEAMSDLMLANVEALAEDEANSMVIQGQASCMTALYGLLVMVFIASVKIRIIVQLYYVKLTLFLSIFFLRFFAGRKSKWLYLFDLFDLLYNYGDFFWIKKNISFLLGYSTSFRL